MIERIHQDVAFKGYIIPGQEVMDKLGRDYPIHIRSRPASYSAIWKTLNINFVDTFENGASEIPDLSVTGGHLFLNEKAYSILKNTLSDYGDFLPIAYEGGTGYLYVAMEVAEDMGALDEHLTGHDQHGNLEHFSFNESKLGGVPIFRSRVDSFNGLFCTTKFTGLVKKAKLTGIYFYPDVSNIIGAAYPESD